MKKTQRKPDRAAVAKSLRELQILFGERPADRNDIAALASGDVGDTELSKLRRYDTTKLGGAL